MYATIFQLFKHAPGCGSKFSEKRPIICGKISVPVTFQPTSAILFVSLSMMAIVVTGFFANTIQMNHARHLSIAIAIADDSCGLDIENS